MNQAISTGRIVLYSLPSGAVRPAIVTQHFGPATANLQVFLDGTNDLPDKSRGNQDDATADEVAHGFAWRTSRQHSEEPKPGYWHWPPRVG